MRSVHTSPQLDGWYTISHNHAFDYHSQAAAFPISDYTPNSIRSAFTSIKSKFPASSSPLRVAVFNVGYGIWKPFLQITDDEVRESLETNVLAAFAFSKEVLQEFTKNDLEAASEGGQGGDRKKGTLIFTGATAALRGNTTTSAFAAGKFGIRALAQSLAKEFGKQNIHVSDFLILCCHDSFLMNNELIHRSHTYVDYEKFQCEHKVLTIHFLSVEHRRRRYVSITSFSRVFLTRNAGIITDRTRSVRNDATWENNADLRLDPNSIAKVRLSK